MLDFQILIMVEGGKIVQVITPLGTTATGNRASSIGHGPLTSILWLIFQVQGGRLGHLCTKDTVHVQSAPDIALRWKYCRLIMLFLH